MNNKLQSVVIVNSKNKSPVYKVRDWVMALLTFCIWGALAAKIFLVIGNGNIFMLGLLTINIMKLVSISFLLTFLSFHCWATYKLYLYNSR